MSFVFPARETIDAPVLGRAETLPIRRIYCVGRNYAAHAKEMGADLREPPCFFIKDADAYAPSGATIAYPPATRDYHYETELVVAIGGEGFNVAPEAALGLIFGYAVGLDMTRRDLQGAAKKAGLPWDTGKNFPEAAPMGLITPAAKAGAISTAEISLLVNGAQRQHSNIADMIWSVPEIVAHLSKLYVLKPGDLIFTGTPEGVGPVKPGDRLVASVAGLEDLSITIGEETR
jgi:fumarylpyruvate hydrolase